jgi:hypothetical protein
VQVHNRQFGVKSEFCNGIGPAAAPHRQGALRRVRDMSSSAKEKGRTLRTSSLVLLIFSRPWS